MIGFQGEVSVSRRDGLRRENLIQFRKFHLRPLLEGVYDRLFNLPVRKLQDMDIDVVNDFINLALVLSENLLSLRGRRADLELHQDAVGDMLGGWRSRLRRYREQE